MAPHPGDPRRVPGNTDGTGLQIQLGFGPGRCHQEIEKDHRQKQKELRSCEDQRLQLPREGAFERTTEFPSCSVVCLWAFSGRGKEGG